MNMLTAVFGTSRSPFRQKRARPEDSHEENKIAQRLECSLEEGTLSSNNIPLPYLRTPEQIGTKVQFEGGKFNIRDVASMRCSSTVSAPVQHCCTPLVAHHSRYIAVHLLSKQTLYFIAQTKSKTKDVYAQTCTYLAGQGMLDCELFGLAIMCDGEYLFVDPDSKLSAYAPKNWKSSSSYGLDGRGQPIFVLHFRVRFYVDTTLLLRNDLTRHNYYLQLRDNAVTRGNIAICSSDELSLILAGYALQADYGDFNECEHTDAYFQLDKYFSKEIISRNGQISKAAVALHKDNRGLTTAEAEMNYIKEASSNELTVVCHNLHLYKLRSRKKSVDDEGAVWLAICAKGIQIYEENCFQKSVATSFLWNNIGKLCFDRKKFEIKSSSSSGEKMTYYTNSDEKSKHLLFLCRVTHQFSMSVQGKVAEIKKLESYALAQEKGGCSKKVPEPQAEEAMRKCEENASSGTGSAVAMARSIANATSLSASQPKKFPQTENLTFRMTGGFTHKLSNVDASLISESGPRRSFQSTPPGMNVDFPNKTLCGNSREADRAFDKFKNRGYKTISNFILHKIVGVDSDYPNFKRTRRDAGKIKKAKEETVLENPKEFDVHSVKLIAEFSKVLEQSGRNASDFETSSSGVYESSNDLNSEKVSGGAAVVPLSEEPDSRTNACSSETSGNHDVNRPTSREVAQGDRTLSSATGFPRRTESDASGESSCESLRWVGSDPSEGGTGSLLTANELSDLIVRRAHNSGTYPSKPTVSSTLDSDSDYVTLPPPPRIVLSATDIANFRLSSRRKSSVVNFRGNNRFVSLDACVNSSERRAEESEKKMAASFVRKISYRPRTFTPPARGEEVNAKFVKTKPHVSVATHSNVPPTPCTPEYAYPTSWNVRPRHGTLRRNFEENAARICSRADSVRGLCELQCSSKSHLSCGLQKGFPDGDVKKIDHHSRSNRNFRKTFANVAAAETTIANAQSDPVLPIVTKNDYLDVQASKSSFVFRRPLATLATVYTSQVTSSQIEQFKQQLYSDVDYVVYPMKDPALSEQEYIDAKQGSLLSAVTSGYFSVCARHRPPSLAERQVTSGSTPNVAAVANDPLRVISKYGASQCDLSCLSQPLVKRNKFSFSPSAPCSTNSFSFVSSQSFRQEQRRFADKFACGPVPGTPGNLPKSARTRSDESTGLGQSQDFFGRPLDFPKSPRKRTVRKAEVKKALPTRAQVKFSECFRTSAASLSEPFDRGRMVDLRVLIEKSKNLDLPLISALCNDKSLLRQTNAFVMPRHPSEGKRLPAHGVKKYKFANEKAEKKLPMMSAVIESEDATGFAPLLKFAKDSEINREKFSRMPRSQKTYRTSTLLETIFSVKNSKKYSGSSKLKYPVSGLATTQISKSQRKKTSAHIHPKLAASGNSGLVEEARKT